jgi:hypothetical protein
MIWKEWRENAKWAALAFAALGLAIVYLTMQGLNRSGDYNSSQSHPLMLIAPATMLFIPLFATALGLLQVGTELRRDQWAFLMHRPVSRSVIFGGKAIAGLSLYLLATSLPVLLLALWVQLPGSVPAPFDWRLLLGPLANVLAGISFYFAGMLTAIRPARWYGSRVLGFGGAIACLVLVNVVEEFWQAMLAILILGALLGLAAWGSFLTTGTYERQPRPAKVALGLALYLGIVVAVGGVTFFVVDTVATRQRSRSFDDDFYEMQYGITPKGQLIKYKQQADGSPANVTDLQGRPVILAKDKTERVLLQTSLDLATGWSRSSNFRSADRYVTSLYTLYQSQTKQLCYWIQNQRRLVLYSKLSNRKIGSLGPGGFVPVASGEAPPFEEDLLDLANVNLESRDNVLSFRHSVYLFNIGERRVKKVFETRYPQGVKATSLAYGNFLPARSNIAVTVNGTVHVLSLTGQMLGAFPLERQDFENFGLSVSVTPDSKRIFLWYTPYKNRAGGKPAQAWVSEFSPKGTLVAKTWLPDLKQPERKFDRTTFWYEVAAPAIETPAVLMAIGYGVTNYFYRKDPISVGQDSLNEVRMYFIYTIIVSLLCVPVAYFVARRAGLNRSAMVGWMVTTLLLGLSGLLLLLALREWPTLLSCPQCRKKRSIERDLCEHCGAAFPAPPQDETAIFEERMSETDLGRLLERV